MPAGPVDQRAAASPGGAHGDLDAPFFHSGSWPAGIDFCHEGRVRRVEADHDRGLRAWTHQLVQQAAADIRALTATPA
jgi:hypothetical protein